MTLNKRFSRRLSSTTSLASGLIMLTLSAAPALAQQTPPPPTDASNIEDVVVTGTRLRVQDYSAANPVTTVTSENIESSGQTNLTQFLTDIPALAGSLTLEQGADTSTPSLAGLNLLNLRNLGADRTLVLVDGRRHVSSSPGNAAVDVNTIPLALVERVEVLTGGASAVYGADGVSGVVNFILKKDFEGIDVRAQTGWTDRGGGDSQLFSALIGQNFAGGRGNVTLSYEFAEEEELKFNDRRFTRSGQRQILVDNPDDASDDPSVPDLILARDARYIDTSRVGSTYTNFFTAPTQSGVSFAGDQPFVDGIYTGSFIALGGSGTPLDDFNDDLLPNLERQTFNATANFELNPRWRLFGELKYNVSDSQFSAQPSYFYGLFLHDENPFIPANVLADARTPFGNATPEGAAAIGLPDLGVLVARDNFDLGTQNYDVDRETWRGVAGIEGDLTDNIRFEASVVYGKSKRDLEARNVIINDRVFAATDVITGPNGQPVCRSNIDPTAVPYGDLFGQSQFPAEAFGATFTPGAGSGCLPINLYGEGRNSAEAVDWITGEFTSSADIDQTVFNAFVSGDTTGFFSLPGGPVGFVAGVERREESSDSRPSDAEVLGETLGYSITGVGRGVRTQGSFEVQEAFAEISLPLLKDLPFAQELTVGAAYRYSDYSSPDSPSVDYQTDTWNVNARWQIVDSLAFRGTVARAARAPNIVDLFLGRSETFEQLADPCSQENLDLGDNSAVRRANCATDLAALGVNPATFINNSSEAISGFISGNPSLTPETADTWTLGAVFTPTFVKGLSISFDYYDIEISNAIQSYAAQTILDNCYDLERPNQFCALIERGTVGGNAGRVTSFEQIPSNISTYTTAGYDVTVRYALDPADFGVTRDVGRFDFTLVGNRLENLSFIESDVTEPTSDVNLRGAPKYQVSLDATWTYDKWSVNYGYSWFNRVNRFSRSTLEAQPDIADASLLKYPARSVHDLQVRYDVSDGLGLYAGVNNLTNQEPVASSYDYPVSAAGRFFYAGLNARFDSLGALFGR